MIFQHDTHFFWCTKCKCWVKTHTGATHIACDPTAVAIAPTVKFTEDTKSPTAKLACKTVSQIEKMLLFLNSQGLDLLLPLVMTLMSLGRSIIICLWLLIMMLYCPLGITLMQMPSVGLVLRQTFPSLPILCRPLSINPHLSDYSRFLVPLTLLVHWLIVQP